VRKGREELGYGRLGQESLGPWGREEKEVAGWAQGKETGHEERENWAGVLGLGWDAGFCYGFSFSISYFLFQTLLKPN
jgi:hypothetical protein